MSNLDPNPVEVVCETGPAPEVQVLDPREVPLGGPRGLTVRRTLPQRRRSLIGAWCFADSYGPTPAAPGTMTVAPHPHTGLQTVSWLYQGRIEHRDSVGSHQVVAPGQVNLMTAGRGIAHSEVSLTGAAALHGVQLWVALPDDSRHVAPFFEHRVCEPFAVGPATVRVFAGSLFGRDAGVRVFSDLVGAQLDLPAGGSLRVPVDPEFEYGLLVDTGSPTLQGAALAAGQLGVVGTDAPELDIRAGAEPLRALLLGGRPLIEPSSCGGTSSGAATTRWSSSGVAGRPRRSPATTRTGSSAMWTASTARRCRLRSCRTPACCPAAERAGWAGISSAG